MLAEVGKVIVGAVVPYTAEFEFNAKFKRTGVAAATVNFASVLANV